MADTEMEDLARLLHFDPFADSPQEKAPETPAAPEAEAAPAIEEAAAPTESEAGAEVAAAEPPTEDLRKRLEDTQQKLAYVAGMVQAQKPQQPAPQEQGPQIPDYNFTLPDQLVALIESEDPVQRRQGLAMFAQGVARTVHANTLSDVMRAREEMAHLMPQYVEAVQKQQNQVREVFQDFYGTHKDLDRPELRPLVVSVAQQILQESGANTWSPELRDKIAGKVRGVLGAYAAPGRRSNQPANVGGGRRPGASPANGQTADIMDVIFGPGG
jgi:hypothetical protein